MIKEYCCAPNSMHRGDPALNASKLKRVRVGISDDFRDAARQYEINATALSPDNDQIRVGLWVKNAQTHALYEMMQAALRARGAGIGGVQARWLEMQSLFDLPGHGYDVLTDHQVYMGPKMPFGFLPHSDGAVPGSTLATVNTYLFAAAMRAAGNSCLIDADHKLTRLPDGPEGAMLFMLPWKGENLYHSFPYEIRHDRMISRGSIAVPSLAIAA